MVLLALCFLGIPVAATCAALKRWMPRLARIEVMCIAVPAGLALATWASLLFTGISGGMGTLSAAVLPIGIFVTAGWIVTHGQRISIPRLKWSEEVTLWWPAWFAVVVFGCVVYGPLFHHHCLSRDGDRWFVGGSCFGDLAVHLQLITSFAYGTNSLRPFWLFESPIYAGSTLVYPFLIDFLSAVLLRSGMSLSAAIWVPSVLIAMSMVGLLYSFAYRFTSSHAAAWLATGMVHLAGGWGFVLFFIRWWSSQDNFFYCLSTLGSQSVDYVHTVIEGGKNPFWFHFVNNVVLPQRTSLFAYPLVLAAFLLVHHGTGLRDPEKKKQRRPFFITAGVVSGLVPLCLGHGFVALAIFCALLALFCLDLFWDWVAMALPACLIGTPQMLYLASRATKWGFAKFRPVWDVEPVPWPKKISEAGPPWLTFWIATLGLLPVLSVVGLVLLSRRQLQFYVGFLVLWILGSFVQLQPWYFDNIKLIYIALFGAAPVVALVLLRITRVPRLGTVLAALLFFCMIASGTLALVRDYQTHYAYFDKEDVELGKWVRENTHPDDMVLNAAYHAHPVPCLSGRHSFMGYAGWLWTHGYEYTERERQLKTMYKGRDDAMALLRKFNVRYVVVGRHENDANRNFYNATAVLVHKTHKKKHRVYKID